jgi:hypothetical protein
MFSIGELRERSLHAALKALYAEPGDTLETRVGGYVIDIVRAGEPPLLIEIQTRGFASMKRKLTTLLDTYPVRLVHPIPAEKWIVRLSAEGEILSRRRAPQRGQASARLFRELVSFPALALHPNLTIDLLLTREDELWRDDGEGSWRRKRWSIADRRLIDVIERVTLTAPGDFAALLPSGLPELFTTADLAAGLKISRGLAGKMAYALREMAVLAVVEKRGNAFVYALNRK